MGLAPYLHACDRPIAITQPAIERVVEMLLQVEGFESEVRFVEEDMLLKRRVIWGLGSLKKTQVAGHFTKGLLDKAHEIAGV